MEASSLLYPVHLAKLLIQFGICLVGLTNPASKVIPYFALSTSILAVLPLFHILSDLLFTLSLNSYCFLGYFCLWLVHTVIKLGKIANDQLAQSPTIFGTIPFANRVSRHSL